MMATAAAGVHAPRRARRLSRLQYAGVIVIGVLAGLALAAWIASIVLRPHLPTPAQLTAKARAQADLTGGAQVYATHCAYCHAHGFGPALGGLGLAAAGVTAIVRSGPGPMPAFPPSQVSDADIAAVAVYLQTLPSAAAAKDKK